MLAALILRRVPCTAGNLDVAGPTCQNRAHGVGRQMCSRHSFSGGFRERPEIWTSWDVLAAIAAIPWVSVDSAREVGARDGSMHSMMCSPRSHHEQGGARFRSSDVRNVIQVQGNCPGSKNNGAWKQLTKVVYLPAGRVLWVWHEMQPQSVYREWFSVPYGVCSECLGTHLNKDSLVSRG